MYNDDSGYELGDPKHPSYGERMSGGADHARKVERENRRAVSHPPCLDQHCEKCSADYYEQRG